MTDTERRAYYKCRCAEQERWCKLSDSLFRGIEVDRFVSDKIQFERALVNSQISNILKSRQV